MKKQPAPVTIVLILVAVVAAAGVIAWFVQTQDDRENTIVPDCQIVRL